MTLQGLIDALTEDLDLTPESQFRLTAQIKRLIHDEKASLCNRLMHYAEGMPIFDRTDPENPIKIGQEPPQDQFIYDTLKEKYLTHEEWAKKPDEEIVTWNVGSHIFVQDRPPCRVCGKVLKGTKESYLRIHGDGEDAGTYCKPCALARNLWEYE
jgi:hypothetical protein